MAQDEVERDEDRELEEERQAGRGRVDVVVPVELHQLFVPLLLVVLVALLDRLHLRHVRLHRLHRVDLLDRERDHAAAARSRSARRSTTPTVSPIVPCGPSQSRIACRMSSSGAEGVDARITGRASAARRSRPRPCSTGCSAAAASRRARSRARARTAAARRSRTGSRTGGTCSRPGRGRRTCSGTRRRARRRGRPEHELRSPECVTVTLPPCRAPRRRARRATRSRFASAAFDEAGPHDQHVVVRRRQRLEPRAPHLAQLALDLRLRTTAPPAPFGTAIPSAGLLAVLAREPVEDEEPRRDGPPVPVDGVEVPRAGEAVPAIARLVRVRQRAACGPARGVASGSPGRRAWTSGRNPCWRFRRRTFG